MNKLIEGDCKADSDAELLPKEAMKWWLALEFSVKLCRVDYTRVEDKWLEIHALLPAVLTGTLRVWFVLRSDLGLELMLSLGNSESIY